MTEITREHVANTITRLLNIGAEPSRRLDAAVEQCLHGAIVWSEDNTFRAGVGCYAAKPNRTTAYSVPFHTKTPVGRQRAIDRLRKRLAEMAA